MRRVSAAEQHGSSMGSFDVEPLKYHCSPGVMVAGSETSGKCVLQTIRNGGSGISMLGKAGLRRLQRIFAGLPKVHRYG